MEIGDYRTGIHWYEAEKIEVKDKSLNLLPHHNCSSFSVEMKGKGSCWGRTRNRKDSVSTNLSQGNSGISGSGRLRRVVVQTWTCKMPPVPMYKVLNSGLFTLWWVYNLVFLVFHFLFTSRCLRTRTCISCEYIAGLFMKVFNIDSSVILNWIIVLIDSDNFPAEDLEI